MERARAAGAAEQHYNPQVHAAQHYAANARHIAVERYRAKRKRRLEAPNTNGARYVKMKAVADGKKRSSSGKFVKKVKALTDGAPVPATAVPVVVPIVGAAAVEVEVLGTGMPVQGAFSSIPPVTNAVEETPKYVDPNTEANPQ